MIETNQVDIEDYSKFVKQSPEGAIDKKIKTNFYNHHTFTISTPTWGCGGSTGLEEPVELEVLGFRCNYQVLKHL